MVSDPCTSFNLIIKQDPFDRPLIRHALVDDPMKEILWSTDTLAGEDIIQSCGEKKITFLMADSDENID